MDVDLRQALQHVRFPAWLLDRDGRFVWLNIAATALVGDLRGKSYLAVVDPAYRSLARAQFTRKLLGEQVTDYEIVLVTQDGSGAPIEVSSVRVDGPDGVAQGVFGLAKVEDIRRQPPAHNHNMTARQAEVLRHLAAGCSTAQIAHEMGISVETVRNHIRHVLRALGVHSRLEAVALARRDGLLPDPPS
jgi:PAS domain S-box-containing protein